MASSVRITSVIASLRQALTINYLDTKTILDISTNEQKKDWFLKLNPNGTKQACWREESPCS